MDNSSTSAPFAIESLYAPSQSASGCPVSLVHISSYIPAIAIAQIQQWTVPVQSSTYNRDLGSSYIGGPKIHPPATESRRGKDVIVGRIAEPFDFRTDAEVAGILINVTINAVKAVFLRAEAADESDIQNDDVEAVHRILQQNEPWTVSQQVYAELFGKKHSLQACWLVLRWIGLVRQDRFINQRLWIFEHALAHSSYWVRDAASLGLLDLGDKRGILLLEHAIQKETTESLRTDFISVVNQLKLA